MSEIKEFFICAYVVNGQKLTVKRAGKQLVSPCNCYINDEFFGQFSSKKAALKAGKEEIQHRN